MKKHIANIITVSRAVFSFPLLFIPLSSAWFCMLYLFCGVTDMIDGTIARRTGAAGTFGARLDTAADFIFTCICAIKILPRICLPVWLWAWTAAIAVVKMCNIVLVFINKKKRISIHSVLNKITGFALFLLPFTLTFIESIYSIATICVLATVAAMHEVYFVAKGKEVL